MNKITTKNLIFLGYFLAFFSFHELRFFNFTWLFLQQILGNLFYWILGIVLGVYFLKVDQLFYIYFTHPELPLSIYVKDLLKQRKIKEALLFLDQRVEEQRLSFRSALFQVVWVGLAFFTLTSTLGNLGKAMVMAIGLKLLLDEWNDFLTPGKNINWLFWQIKRVVTLQEQRWFLWIMTGIFGILSLLLI